MRYTADYKQLQEQFHAQRPDYGANAHRWADQLATLAQQLNTRDVLDYGAGKGTLAKGLPFPIAQYDPFVPEFAREPAPAAIVACLDVLEHIEPECLDAVLAHLASLTKNILFAEIATRPAAKFLPDGRNAHLIIESGNWWLAKLLPHFAIQQWSSSGTNAIVLATPLKPPAPVLSTYLPSAA